MQKIRIRKLIGSAVQLGVTAVVSQNSALIQSAGISLIKYFIQKNRKKATTLNTYLTFCHVNNTTFSEYYITLPILWILIFV
jgi:hypothetical protein